MTINPRGTPPRIVLPHAPGSSGAAGIVLPFPKPGETPPLAPALLCAIGLVLFATSRDQAGAVIEALIARLDALDGDPDLEASGDAEPNGDEFEEEEDCGCLEDEGADVRVLSRPWPVARPRDSRVPPEIRA